MVMILGDKKMNLIPYKIEFTNIQSAFANGTVEGFPFSKGYPVVLDLEADITIEINDVSIFDCPLTPIIELYLQLKKWFDYPITNNFMYLSLEACDPIFEVKKCNEQWYFISDFTKQKVRTEINILSFKKSASIFLANLEKKFEIIFDIELETLLTPFL